MDPLLFQLRILFRRRDHQAIVLFAKDSGRALRHFGKKRVDQIRNDQPHHERAACGKTSRRLIRSIVEFLDAFQNTAPRFVANFGEISNDLGNSHDRDPQITGDVFHSNAQKGPPIIDWKRQGLPAFS